MFFELPQLPYDTDALSPFMSKETIALHYGKHHQTYVANLNNLLKGTDLKCDNLECLIAETAGKPDQTAVFNNAAQVWNHSFFWKCLTPLGGGALPDGAFKTAVLHAFDSEENFKEKLKEAALAQFGSGWAWVVAGMDGIDIVKTANADTPVARGMKPLFTIDVWEHAYYLDYNNRRGDYVQALIDRLANWHFAAAAFAF